MSITILNDSFDDATLVDSNDFIFDFVDESSDPRDYYTFSLGEDSFVDIYLSDLFDDADLYLYDSSRDLIASSENGGVDSEYLSKELSIGDYFIEVYAYSGFTDYYLDIYSFSVGVSEPEDPIAIAPNDSRFGSVDQASDPSDTYQFTLVEDSFVDIYVSDLFSDADLYLYDNNGNLISSSENGGFESEYLYEQLSAGDYSIEVYAYLGFTDYLLDVYSTPIMESTPEPGSDPETALPIQSNDYRFDSVDEFSDPIDYYTFSLRNSTFVDIQLFGLSADADLYLYDETGQEIASSYFSDNTDEYISQELAGGNYFIKVESYSGNTDYELSIASFGDNAPIFDDGNNTFETADSINVGDSVNQRVGISNDPNDYYSFNLDSASVVNIRLTGLSSDVDIELYDLNRNYIDGSFSFDTQDELISTALPAGKYFINVIAYEGETQYDLSLQSENATGIPGDNAGNDLNSALPIAFNNNYSDWVGPEDPNDYYQLLLNSSTEIRVQLTGLSADADLELIDGSGNIISFSENGGTEDENISELLESGTYYIRVKPFGGTFTNYSLSVLGQEQSTPTEPNAFNSQTGYGFLDASLAVANVLGQNSPFPSVGSFGGDNDWPINMVNAPTVWNQGYTGDGIVVAVLDTGVDRNHPDLFNNIWTNSGEIPGNGIDDDGNGFTDDVWGWNFARNDNNTLDAQGHGTHVAGTIAGANDGNGVTGIAYQAQIMPVKVLGDDGFGSYEGIANGIVYAVQNGANVINMSLGGPDLSPVIEDAIAYASSQGVIVVSAAGNQSAPEPSTPARYAVDYGVAVGAVGRSNNLADFSNQAGNNPSMIYVTAPGEGIFSSIPNGRFDTWDGTSMATPHVAGIVALMLDANPNLSDGQVRQIITSSTIVTPEITTNLSSFGIQSVKSSVAAPSFFFSSDGSTVNIPQVTLPVVNVSIAPSTASEADATTFTITVTANNAVNGQQTVALALSGTATVDDFGGNIPNSIAIADGATTGSVTVTLTNDDLVEGNETATFTISNPSSGIVLGDTTSTSVTITDNDSAMSELNDRFYRFQNTARPGTYLFAGEEERISINRDFSPPFKEEGFAFNVSKEEQDGLVRFNRFQNKDVPGTYLFANEEESATIRQKFPQFEEEGTAFYAFGADANRGQDVIRFQNIANPGTYLFALEDEAASIRKDFSSIFKEEGVAFEVTI